MNPGTANLNEFVQSAMATTMPVEGVAFSPLFCLMDTMANPERAKFLGKLAVFLKSMEGLRVENVSFGPVDGKADYLAAFKVTLQP